MACVIPLYARRQPETSILHRVFENHWLEFLNSIQSHDDEKNLPGFVIKEVKDYFKCGILANGFVRFYCKDCKKSQVVAFSCKRRGFCPSCCARRMNHTAAHLTDYVFPDVGVRQWVLSFPFSLRFLMAYRPKLTSQILKVFINTVQSRYRKKAKELGFKNTQGGAVTVIQRAGGALNSNVHFHTLFLDGVYLENNERFQFLPIYGPDAEEVKILTEKIRKKVIRLLDKKGYFDEDQASSESAQESLTQASIMQTSTVGERAGKIIRRLKNELLETNEKYSIGGGVNISGFSLHANVKIPAGNRKKLEKLCRYISRGPIATERMFEMPGGDIGYKMKRPWHDGTTHVLFTPHELIEKLVALIPPPRANLVRYHGVLAPNSKWREHVVPKVESVEPKKSAPGQKVPNMNWSEMLKRVFAIDATKCQFCGGQLKLIATVKETQAIQAILESMELPAVAPKFKPARGRAPPSFDQFSDSSDESQLPANW